MLFWPLIGEVGGSKINHDPDMQIHHGYISCKWHGARDMSRRISASSSPPVVGQSSAIDQESDPLSVPLKRKQPQLPAEYGRPTSKMPKNAHDSVRQNRSTTKRRTVNSPMSNLVGANIFDEVTASDQQSKPSFNVVGNRGKAIHELFKDHPGRASTNTREEFKAACRAFGKRNAQPAGEDVWSLKGLKAKLANHQLLGAGSLRQIEQDPKLPDSGILADQMGLGKTVMMLANIVNGRRFQRRGSGPTLIVATKPLIDQWRDEIELHCEEKVIGDVLTFTSKLNENAGIEKLIKKYKVVLTTYAEVRKSLPKIEQPKNSADPQELLARAKEINKKLGVLHRIEFHRVVLDEAQAIKNHLSRTSRACILLKAKYRWAMSGTPIQNSLEELYPYFAFLRLPKSDDLRAFKSEYLENKHTPSTALSEQLGRCMIRRVHKDQILDSPLIDLPTKKSRLVPLTLSGPEASLYSIFEEKSRLEIAQALQGPAKKSSEETKSLIITVILRLRQLTAHFTLIGPSLPSFVSGQSLDKLIQVARGDSQPFDDSKLKRLHDILRERKAVKYPKQSKGSKSRKSPHFCAKRWLQESDNTVLFSTKLAAIKTQISAWIQQDPQRKIIVFTQFTGVIQLIEQVCYEEKWGCASYHGKIDPKARAQNLADFKSDPRTTILISSLTCGGIGLNLTQASRVIIPDLWWNTPTEQQAFARVYRIGQTEPTEVVRLYVKGTIDERILSLQDSKAECIQKVFKEDAGEAIRQLTVGDLVGLVGGVPKDDTEMDVDVDDMNSPAAEEDSDSESELSEGPSDFVSSDISDEDDEDQEKANDLIQSVCQENADLVMDQDDPETQGFSPTKKRCLRGYGDDASDDDEYVDMKHDMDELD